MATPYSIYNTRSGTDANAPVTVGTAVSGTSTFYSDPWSGEAGAGFGLTVFFTGTPTGTFTEWFTDKPNPSLADDSDWVQNSGFSPTNPAGAAGKFRQDDATSRSYRRRLKYVNASGTGTISAFVNVVKQIA